MRILYVSSLWTSFREVLLKNFSYSRGMPGFFNTLNELQNLGHKVDLILISHVSTDKELLTKSKASSLGLNYSIKDVIVYKPSRMLKKVLTLLLLYNKVYKSVKEAIKSNSYDFIYSQGSYAVPSSIIAARNKIPCGQRLYGSFVWRYFKQKGLVRTLFFDPFEIMSYFVPKDFMLITDDGSDGNKALMYFTKGHMKYRFVFLRNGVDVVSNISEKTIQDYRKTVITPSIFYVGRVVQWKRQDRAIDVLYDLKKHGIVASLYFAGQIEPSDLNFYKAVIDKAKELDVFNQLTFLGSLTREEICIYAKICDISLLLYDITNMGNVFHELLADGAAIVALNDGTLNDYLINGTNGYLIDNERQASFVIKELINNLNLNKKIRDAAARTSKNMMQSWGDRVSMEIQLIEEAVQKKNPTRLQQK